MSKKPGPRYEGNAQSIINLCYQYRYDERNRPSQKKLPGKGWEYTVYNQLNQPVLTQDASQRTNNQWTVTKYDGQGRVIMTGLWNAGQVYTLAALQASIYAGAQWDTRNYADNITGYAITSYPAAIQILTVNYYDDYNNIPGLPAAFVVTGNSTSTTGLLTGTKTAVLNTVNATSPDYLSEVNYYDDLGRVTQTYKQHYQGGRLNPGNYDVVVNTYDFTNVILTTSRKHYNAATSTTAPAVTIANTYTYDHMGRKRQVQESINGGTSVIVSQLDYNEIGQVLTKHLHSETGAAPFLQDIPYTYNERGWLRTTGTGSLFTEDLRYNNPDAGISQQFNGNISEMLYSKTGVSGGITDSYSYDQINRLTSGTSSDSYNETGITYDLHGNIQTLQRTYGSATAIDNLSYTYAGTNQVQSISDAAPDVLTGKGYKFSNGSSFAYTYDPNGNMQTDVSKGITNISYNLLNLPVTYTMGTSTSTFTYDATGNKLRKVQVNGSTTTTSDYVSGIQYYNGAILFIQTEEGRALWNGSTYIYNYSLTDHLGNARLTFDSHTTTATQVQQDDYMPFGMEISRGPTVSPKNEYLYNKKELQEELGLDDYGARFYDPVIARWTTVDPMTEKSRRWSPYNYAENNPVRFIDPDGMETEDPQKKVNSTVTSVEDKSHNLHVTQSTTTTTVVKTETGSITTKTTVSATDIISNSETQGTVRGDVTTKTNVTTVDGDKTSTTFGDPTTVSRADSKADLSNLNSVDKSLESFRNDHHEQFNDAVDKAGNSFLSKAFGLGTLPFAAAASLSTYLPTVARVLSTVGAPTSAAGAGKSAIDAAHPVGSPKMILVTSNGQVVSDIRPQKYK